MISKNDDAVPRLIGVDGAKSRWIAVWRAHDSLDYGLYASPGALLERHPRAEVVAVDIPIGLSDKDGRRPDALARTFVGARRASSIFSSPVRGILDATSQPEASRRHREIDGRGFGAQSFAILPKIRQWDTLLREDSDVRRRVYEIHPEVSFAAINGGVGLADRKKSPEGQAIRKGLLSRSFGQEAISSLIARVPRREAAMDDVLDALVALWTAGRISSGEAKSLPHPHEIDSAGLRMAIWY